MKKKINLLDFINKFDYIICLLLLSLFIYFFNNQLFIIYNSDSSIIDNIISLFGTLFGFILTCLSIFIVFKTDNSYKENSPNFSLSKLLSNPKFNDLYNLFIKNIYCMGIVLLMSFFIYFVNTNDIYVSYIVSILYFYFVFLSIIRTILSILAFKYMIQIITKGN